MHGLLRCNINTGGRARAQSGRVTQRCHNSPDEKRGLEGANDVTHRKRARRILGILKKSVSWVENWTPNEKGWLSLARGGLGQVSHEIGGRWKSQNRKNVYLSPYVEEPLNSKVIKSFVPELRSRYVFSCFKIPMFHVYVIYIYIWTLYVHFTHSRIWLLPPPQGKKIK